jgi:hypothetical protein
MRRLLVEACIVPSSPILVTLMKEALDFSETRFLQEPHSVTSQKTPFFIATAVKTSNLTKFFKDFIDIVVAKQFKVNKLL